MKRLWSEKVLILAVVTYVVFWGTVWALYRTTSPVQLKITVYDQVARPGEEVEVGAKFESDGPGFLNPDRKGLAASMSLLRTDGTTTSVEGVTDNDGVLHATLRAPNEPGRYLLQAAPNDRVRYLSRSVSIPAQLFVLEPTKPILVCDIDGTITVGGDWKTLVPGGGPQPQPGAASELNALTQSYTVLLLTARDDALLNRTRAWLQRHRFPSAPVVGRDWNLFNLARAASFKAAILENWQKRFGNIAWGIGNSSGDRTAYREAKIRHIMLGGDPTSDAEDTLYHPAAALQTRRQLLVDTVRRGWLLRVVWFCPDNMPILASKPDFMREKKDTWVNRVRTGTLYVSPRSPDASSANRRWIVSEMAGSFQVIRWRRWFWEKSSSFLAAATWSGEAGEGLSSSGQGPGSYHRAPRRGLRCCANPRG